MGLDYCRGKHKEWFFNNNEKTTNHPFACWRLGRLSVATSDGARGPRAVPSRTSL